MNWLAASLAVIALALLGHGVYFLGEHRAERQYLQSQISEFPEGADNQAFLKFALGKSFDIPPHRSPDSAPDYNIRHPLMSALGPSASMIHQHGGHCGRRSRLLVALLNEQGLSARKVHLINDSFLDFGHAHHYVHAVVEVEMDGQWVVLDPLYNIAFQNPSGQLASLHDIRNDPENIFWPTVREADTQFSPYYEELYQYGQYRKFIWNSFPGGERVYELLVVMIGADRARDIPTPAWIENPLRTIAAMSLTGALIFAFGAIALWRTGNSRVSSTSGNGSI